MPPPDVGGTHAYSLFHYYPPFIDESAIGNKSYKDRHDIILEDGGDTLEDIFPPKAEGDLISMRDIMSVQVLNQINMHKFWQCLLSGTVTEKGPSPEFHTIKIIHLPWWLVSAPGLQARGYFANAVHWSNPNWRRTQALMEALLSLEEDCPQRQCLVHNRDYWNHPDRSGAIDELNQSRDRFTNNEDYFWPENGATLHPNQLLLSLRDHERALQLGPEPEKPFDHLVSLKDGCGMKVLRSKQEIFDAASRLHNCAVNEIDSVERKTAIIVTLEQSKNGKLIAMGKFDQRHNTFVEIREVNNRTPSEATIEKFAAYEPIVQHGLG